MAVRLDIRPRIVLRDEPVAKVRRRVRLPPLTFPAVGYWVAMGALTYFFAHLGERPLENAFAAPQPEPTFAPMPLPAAEPEPLPAPPAMAAPDPASLAPAPGPEPEPEPEPDLVASADELAPPRARDREREAPATRDRERDRRREAPLMSEAEPPRTPEPAPRVAISFPEFTDTSRRSPRERAAAGPRIESDLFGGGSSDTARPEPGPDTSRAPDSEPSRPVAAMSCEAAVARNREQIEIGGPRGPADVTRDAYAGILENGRYLSGCSIPERTVFEVCAAVQNGRAVGVTVTSNPPSAALNSCVRRAVSRLNFPNNPRLDVTHTRFDAVRR